MSLVARRENVTHPIAVQITVPSAIRPVMLSTPVVFGSDLLHLIGGDDATLGDDQIGDVAVDHVDQPR